MSTIEDFKQANSLMDVLLRHGVRVRGKSVNCPAPGHHDNSLVNASIYTAIDGDQRVKCFACGFDEDAFGVASALGESPNFSDTSFTLRRIVKKPAPNILTLHGKPLPPDAELAEQEHGQILAWVGKRWEKVTGDRRQPEYNATSFPGSKRHAEYLEWVKELDSTPNSYTDEAAGFIPPAPYCSTCDSEH